MRAWAYDASSARLITRNEEIWSVEHTSSVGNDLVFRWLCQSKLRCVFTSDKYVKFYTNGCCCSYCTRYKIRTLPTLMLQYKLQINGLGTFHYSISDGIDPKRSHKVLNRDSWLAMRAGHSDPFISWGKWTFSPIEERQEQCGYILQKTTQIIQENITTNK